MTAATPTSQDDSAIELAVAAEFLSSARFAGAMTATPAVAALVRARVPLAVWLGCLAVLDPSERGGDTCGWCGSNHALAIARAMNGTET